MNLPKSIQTLIDELAKLPGIGPKTAQRLAVQILKRDLPAVEKLGRSIIEAKETLKLCRRCFNWSEFELCPICQMSSRDQSLLCVVEEVLDLIAIESTLEYKGLYHVLHGAIAPLDGVGPEQIRLPELVERLSQEPAIKEVILATNTSLEGEATAMLIYRKLKDFPVTITRLAKGIPMGGGLEYADDRTLGISIKKRSTF